MQAKAGILKWPVTFPWRKIMISALISLGIYLLLILPVFFMYPHYDDPVKKNINNSFFIALSDTLAGDCYRVSENFERECPFPTREIHLSSDHTILEIKINEKWYAYDPLYKKFFNDNNVMKIAFDVNRGYIPKYLENYKYAYAFKDVKYYHSLYFVILNYVCPFYDDIMRNYYSLKE